MFKLGLKIVTILALLGFFLLTLVPSPHKSFAGRLLRFCAGEPGATQDVNDAADTILSRKWEEDLELFAGQMIKEFETKKDTFPPAFMGGYLLPTDRLPAHYRKLSPLFLPGLEPELVMKLSGDSTETQIVIDWAHMRHAVIIYAKPPKQCPEGFYIRKVNERIYVVAGAS